MADFVEVARLEQVFNVEGTVYAIQDSCLHKGASLGTGQLDGKVVTCRAHGWHYDVTTGSTKNAPGLRRCLIPEQSR